MPEGHGGEQGRGEGGGGVKVGVWELGGEALVLFLLEPVLVSTIPQSPSLTAAHCFSLRQILTDALLPTERGGGGGDFLVARLMVSIL